MKLYCVRFKNVKDAIIDVTHILENDNKEVHKRLDYFLKQCKAYNVEEYQSYDFFEVNNVDGFDIGSILINTDIVKPTIINE